MSKAALALVLAGAIVSGSALAGGSRGSGGHGGGGHHGGGYHGGYRGHVGVGVYFGAPLWYGYYGPSYFNPYYYDPYYYPPYSSASPPVYIEQGHPAPAPAPSQGYWYYCLESKSYYPYVQQCPGDWQRVSPTPPGL